MTEPDPSRASGSHRRERGGNRVAVLIASLVGVAVAAGLVVFALHQRGEPAHDVTPTTQPPHPSATSPSSPSAAAPSSSLTPSLSPSLSPPAPTASTASTPPQTSGSPSTAAPSTSSPPVAAFPALDVLNDSRITGLAARASAQFTEAGWNVAMTGNFHGPDVPSTTIFYPDGDRAAAERLAAQFRIRRVLPAIDGLSSSHLTVALARDWASRG